MTVRREASVIGQERSKKVHSRERSLVPWAVREAEKVGVKVPRQTTESKAFFDDEDDPFESRKVNKWLYAKFFKLVVFVTALIGLWVSIGGFMTSLGLLFGAGVLSGTLFASLIGAVVCVFVLRRSMPKSW